MKKIRQLMNNALEIVKHKLNSFRNIEVLVEIRGLNNELIGIEKIKLKKGQKLIDGFKNHEKFKVGQTNYGLMLQGYENNSIKLYEGRASAENEVRYQDYKMKYEEDYRIGEIGCGFEVYILEGEKAHFITCSHGELEYRPGLENIIVDSIAKKQLTLVLKYTDYKEDIEQSYKIENKLIEEQKLPDVKLSYILNDKKFQTTINESITTYLQNLTNESKTQIVIHKVINEFEKLDRNNYELILSNMRQTLKKYLYFLNISNSTKILYAQITPNLILQKKESETRSKNYIKNIQGLNREIQNEYKIKKQNQINFKNFYSVFENIKAQRVEQDIIPLIINEKNLANNKINNLKKMKKIINSIIETKNNIVVKIPKNKKFLNSEFVNEWEMVNKRKNKNLENKNNNIAQEKINSTNYNLMKEIKKKLKQNRLKKLKIKQNKIKKQKNKKSKFEPTNKKNNLRLNLKITKKNIKILNGLKIIKRKNTHKEEEKKIYYTSIAHRIKKKNKKTPKQKLKIIVIKNKDYKEKGVERKNDGKRKNRKRTANSRRNKNAKSNRETNLPIRIMAR